MGGLVVSGGCGNGNVDQNLDDANKKITNPGRIIKEQITKEDVNEGGEQFTDSEQREINEFLATYGNDIEEFDYSGRTLLHIAVAPKLGESGNFPAVRYLVTNRSANVNVIAKNGTTPLFLAVTCPDNIGIVRFLVSNGADVNAETPGGSTPLHNAAGVEIARFLVSKGADINAMNRLRDTPLDNAKVFKREAVVDYLRSIGAKSGKE